MPGSEHRISVSSWRMTAESSTTRTRIFLFIIVFSVLEQFHRSGFDLRDRGREFALAFEHRAVDGRGKALDAHLAGRRSVEDLARETVAEILGGDEETLGLEIVAHELRIARAHVERHVEHLAAADHLELEIRSLAAEHHDVVDQPLHRDVAVARRRADEILGPGAGAARAVERQHEVIHTADPQFAFTHAGRHTRAENGKDGFVVPRDVVIARQQFGDRYAQARVPRPADVPELTQRQRQRQRPPDLHPHGGIEYAHSTRRYTVRPTSLQRRGTLRSFSW